MEETKKNEQAMPVATPLRQALHDARVEVAERSAVIIELRDAEMARLQLLNEAIDPVFKDIPAQHAEFFDRGVSGGTSPRLWLDAVTHVDMGRDKRTYRLLTDTANGRRILEESTDVAPMRETITRYVARKLVQREQALAATDEPLDKNKKQPRRRKPGVGLAFLMGALFGAAALIAIVLLMPLSN
jgi:hypothetical protein